MADYNLTVPDGANSFQYGTDSSGNPVSYTAGSRYETNNPCDAIAFYNAAGTTNASIGRADATAGFWADTDRACNAQVASAPPLPPPSSPVEANPNPTGGDSGVKQGAPNLPPQGNVGGENRDGDSGNNAGDGINPNPAPTEEPTRPPTGEPHPTNGGDQPQEQTNAGDPVDIFSGSFYLQETDLTIPNTILPLSFTRFYRSGVATFGPFGWNWDHNFNLFLRELNTGDVALWRNLHEEIFKFNGADFEPQRGVFEKLERVIAIPQVYEIKAEGGIEMHFERPAAWVDGERIPLLWIKDRHGNHLQFNYGADDKLTEVKDDDSRFFRFKYDACGLLVFVSDHTGRNFIYEHDEENMHLLSVKSPPISDHPNGIVKTYYYEEPWTLPKLRHNIVRVEDASGNIYLENTYEQDPALLSFARVTEQLYGGYLFQFQYTQLQWVPDNSIYINIPAWRVEVMNPDFALETYTFNYRGDLLDRRYRLSKDNSYRVVVYNYEFDEQGNLSRTTNPDGSEIINIFDFTNADPRMRGKLLQRELTAASGFPAPSRIIWKGRYETTYQLIIEEKNETAAIVKYKYDFDITPAALNNTGKLMELIQPDATLPDGTIQAAITKYEYNVKGQPVASVLADGTRNKMEYGVAGNEISRLVKQIFDVGGLDIEAHFIYNLNGFNSEKIDGNGNTTKQVYNILGLVEKFVLPPVGGVDTAYVLHYDSDKKVISSERPKGNFSDGVLIDNFINDQFERDVLGFPVKYTFSTNTGETRIIKINNNYRGFPIETINPDGSRLLKTYDERGLLLKEEVAGSDGKKITSRRFYDRTGKLMEEIHPSGVTIKYEYDGFSRLIKTTLGNGTEIKNSWLKNDLLESEETIGDDGSGVIRQLSFKSYSYDEKNRRSKETVKSFSDNPAISSDIASTYYYDNLDRVQMNANNRGGLLVKQYDGLGRMVKEVDPMGNENFYSYDGNGNIIQSDYHHKEPGGAISIITKRFTYDSRNRRIELIEPDGAKILSEYDDRNLLVKQTDYLGIAKEYFYNSYNDKIKEAHDPAGLNIIHQWTIDNMSRTTAYTDPMGQLSNYFYDSAGRNFKVDYANGFSSIKSFNNNNQVVNELLGSGVEFNYSYDVFGRMIKIENSIFPAQVIKVDDHEFKYDGLNRVISAKAGADAVSRKYDSQNRITHETTLGNTISCNYTDASGEIEKKWPDGRTEKLSHDLNGVLSRIEETISGALGSGNAVIAYYKPSGPNFFGNANYAGGTLLTNKYDERKRITELNATSPAGLGELIQYRYNTLNQKMVEAFSGQNPKVSFFDFDKKYRLLNASDGFSSPVPNAVTQAQHDIAINTVKFAAAAAAHQEKFLYNPSDARTKYSESGVPDKNYIYLAGYKIQNDGTNAYTHFTDGTLESDGIFSYEADALGRIINIKSGATIITQLKYDAFGRPSIVKENGKPDKSFNYFGEFVEQVNENGAPARQVTIHPYTGVPVAFHSNAGTHYTLFDNRFNLIGLVDDTGVLVETYRYKSFGAPQIFNNAGALILASSFNIEPVFGGQKYLASCGLYLSTRRLMNPLNGFYLSSDPKGYIDSPSLYIYVGQDPINNIDPEGEFFFLAILAVMAVGALVSGGINAARQGIAIAEGSQTGWEWGQFGKSVAFGSIAAPILVVAPELAIPLAGYGLYSGVNAISKGNYATGTFDIVTSLLPFASKNVRSATFGADSAFGGLRSGGVGGSRVTHISTAEAMEAIQLGNSAEGIPPASLRSTPGAKGISSVLEGTGEGAWVSPFEASRLTPWRRLMTGLPNRSKYVEFDVMPNEVQNPGGVKSLFSRWQRQIPSPLDANGNPSGWINLQGRNPQYGELPLPKVNWPILGEGTNLANWLSPQTSSVNHPNQKPLSSK